MFYIILVFLIIKKKVFCNITHSALTHVTVFNFDFIININFDLLFSSLLVNIIYIKNTYSHKYINNSNLHSLNKNIGTPYIICLYETDDKL